ncbi:hypothetical protein [Robiginitalea sediminis]|uniref:hypothetical protein n=1 Tax=Robiginitalea sediminis TaxID=1982593 RepID=UPI000B4A7215|nr:hypothetical protein [Robiginitalea sediminis]
MIRSITIGVFCLFTGMWGAFSQEDRPRFDVERDLLLAHYDCKTDVDDLHSVAALATLLSTDRFDGVTYHAVAGAYGVQEGLYVPPNELFEAAFAGHWSDAHTNREQALTEVLAVALRTLDAQGDIWIPEAGQSDFSAALVRRIQQERPSLNVRSRIHIVQHSDWNEEVTAAEALVFVKAHTDYWKIPDGNATGNGTPGFRSDDPISGPGALADAHLREVWELAIRIANRYNGADGRYLNTSIAKGGLDFSDTAEVCWIFGMEHLEDANAFFGYISGK